MEVSKAVSCYKEGCNCSQAILKAFSEKVGIDEKTAMKIGAGFGGGMNVAGTCGAVTGAVMAIGMKYGNEETGDLNAKKNSSIATRNLIKEFTQKNMTTECRELKGTHKKDCNVLVQDAAEILNKILG